MKTLTEFAVVTLKNAHQKKQELASAGKTPEEIPAALGEALKLEGDKLAYLLAALEVVGDRTNDLKRVIVSSLAEGETAPSRAQLVGDKYYAVEFYPPIHKAGSAPRSEGRPDQGRGGRRGDGKGKKGGRREGRGGRDGGPRGPGERAPRQATTPAPRGAGPAVRPLVKPVEKTES